MQTGEVVGPSVGPLVSQDARLFDALRSLALVQAQVDTALRAIDLTVDRWRALWFIRRNPGSAMADLIDALVMPSTSATRTVDALVEVGAVFRAHDPVDRRRVVLQVSSDGLALLAAASGVVDAVELPAAVVGDGQS